MYMVVFLKQINKTPLNENKPDQIVDVLKNHLKKKAHCSVCSGAKKPVPYKKPPY